MAQAHFFSSTAQPTTLTSSISNTTTSIPLAATTGFPVQFPYTIALDYGNSLEELCDVTSVAGLNANVTRAVDGTTAASHSVGAPVRHVSSARDFNGFYIHIGSSAGVHGVTGNVVGDTDTQTLSNKTLTNPTVNSATLSGTVAGSPTFSGNVTFSGAATSLAGGTVTGNWNANATFTANLAANVPLTIKGAVSQTGDLFDVQLNGGTKTFQIFSGGNAFLNSTVTGFPAFQVNTPLGQTSDLLDLQINGSSIYTFPASGVMTGAGLNFTQTSASTVPIFVRLASSPSVNLMTITSSGSVNQFQLLSGGQMVVSPSTGTGVVAATVNAPSGQTADLLDLQVNGTNQFSVSNTGAVLAGNITATTSYTPTIGGGALTLGNGVMTAFYTQVGTLFTVHILITCGTTTSLAATGNLTFTLPTAASEHATVAAVGTSYFTKTSGGIFNLASTVLTAGASTFTYFTTPSGTMQAFNTTNAAAVASGSVIVADLTFMS